MSSHTSYIVTLKDDASPDDIQKCKDDIKAKGGEITHEYSLIKAFACKVPSDHISSLESHPMVGNLEKDQEMKTC